jgi:hypothetical protein
VRSSGRIPKEIPILLIGSDLNGKVFSEPTTTVLLSLHGAGLLSRHKLSPEQELVLRWTERNKETEIRVVGQLGSQNGKHTYGVAFFDPGLNFWEIDFPPASAAERELGLLSLACTHCKSLEKVDDSGPEADVCATNDGVLRFCKRCGAATLWKPASGAPQQSVPAAIPQSPASEQLPLFSVPAAPPPSPISASPSHYDPASATLPVAPPIPAAPPSSYYAQSPEFALDSSSSSSSSNFQASRPDSRAEAVAASADLVGTISAPVGEPRSARPSHVWELRADAQSEPQAAVLTMSGPAAEKPAAPPAVPGANRRKHPRVKVAYSACVRVPGRGDDVVQCEDMSKGGLRFKSRQQYYARTFIEVAVPYQPGQPAIFVPAQIVFAEELPEQRLYRCGVQYLTRSTKPRPYS